MPPNDRELHAELDALRRRVAELEQQQQQPHRSYMAANESRSLLLALIDNSPALIYVKDVDGRFILTNRRFAALAGVDPARLYRQLDSALPEPVALALRPGDAAVLATGQSDEREDVLDPGTERRIFLANRFPIRNQEGVLRGVGAILTDITALRQVEAERLALQQHVVAAQQATLRELGAPLIPIAQDVVALPLIGAVDSQRAQQVIETLLRGVAELRARIAILDITGVALVDTQVANVLLQAARAVRLLGAEVVLTGIRPEIAQTLVGLGVDLGSMTTVRSLQDGIAYALQVHARRQ